MPTPTYTPLANLTLSANAASVTFSSISQAYRDLVLVCNYASATTTTSLSAVLNSNTGSVYSYVTANANGSTASSYSGSSTSMQLGWDASADSTTNATNTVVQFLDYSVTDKHKPILFRSNRGGASSGGTDIGAFRFATTTAITSIQLLFGSPNLKAGSTFALYGIAS